MNVLTVSQVNTYIRALLEESAPLKNVYISGEISNFKHAVSGHKYFTLKDSKSQLKCVMFASSANRLRFVPSDGMHVICRGRIGVYEKDGAYQLYVDDMQPEGIGALAIAFEQLKQRLADAGLFDEIYKKPLPVYPRAIGVATSLSGAAVQDIKNITKRRFPMCELVLCSTIVQGDAAPGSIVAAIERLDAMPEVDVIIVGRGGGSIEDLWAFNTEAVAQVVFNCKTPIISAVGHETDYTICDFAADLRAPTPSAAAELALPDAAGEYQKLAGLQRTLSSFVQRRVFDERQRLDRIASQPSLMHPAGIISAQREQLAARMARIQNSMQYCVAQQQRQLMHLADILNAYNPLSVLQRGYAVVSEGDKTIISRKQILPDAHLELTFADGSADIIVSEVIQHGEDNDL